MRLYAGVCGVVAGQWVLSAAGKSEGGLDGVVGGMTVIVMLAYTMRLLRGGIAAVEDMRQAYIVEHIRKLPLFGLQCTVVIICDLVGPIVL